MVTSVNLPRSMALDDSDQFTVKADQCRSPALQGVGVTVIEIQNQGCLGPYKDEDVSIAATHLARA